MNKQQYKKACGAWRAMMREIKPREYAQRYIGKLNIRHVFAASKAYEGQKITGYAACNETYAAVRTCLALGVITKAKEALIEQA